MPLAPGGCQNVRAAAYLDCLAAESPVASLLRFLIVVGGLAGAVYAGMWSLATFIEPQPREMTQTLPANKLAGK